MKQFLFLLIANLYFFASGFSQNNVGIGTVSPNNSAQLDITSTTQGLLIPRMTTAGITSIANPAKGLLVYDTVKNQLMVNMGTAGVPNWQTIVFNSGWSLTGNSGTNPAVQFLGTTDNQPLNIKVNNLPAGKIDNNLHNVLLGINSGLSNTTGRENTFAGDSSGFNNTTGQQNSFLGRRTGFSNTTGYFNSFFGNEAGYFNTTGYSNSFFGNEAGYFNTTGYSNSFFGYQAGYFDTTGDSNSFFGFSAGMDNTTGFGNSFFGVAAGASNSSGYLNSFFGTAAGILNSTGINNSFFGNAAGNNNTDGNFNSFFGNGAGTSNTHGSNNSFFGFLAGLNNTTGNQNTFIGERAGILNTTGGGNSFVGDSAGYNTTTGSFNSFFGRKAGSNITTANFNSFFGNQTGEFNTSGTGNSFFGIQSGQQNTTGSSNSFFGSFAGNANTIGSQNNFLGFNSNASVNNLSNATAIGANAFVSVSNSMVLGSINGINSATADTKVGIGTTTPAARLHVSQGSFGGTYLFDDFIVEDNNSTYVNVLSPTANENGILFGLTDNAASGGIVYNNASTHKGLQFRTFNNTTKMVIDSVGNIGIGTQTPSYGLHVVNNNGADGGFANGIVVENINASTGEAAISFKNAGTTGTGNKLWVVGLNQDRNLDFNYGTTFATSTTKMVIDSTGNVGIANTTPAEKLDITGNIKVSGNVTRPSTGAANLVPICYGTVGSSGTIDSGTGNFSVVNTSTGLYTITITGESYSLITYSSIVTPVGLSAIIPATFSSGVNLTVRLFNTSGASVNGDFNFVVYKN